MKKEKKQSQNNKDWTGKRGLACCSPEKRKEVASKGGRAVHKIRGLQAADVETRKRVAKKGGEASYRYFNEKKRRKKEGRLEPKDG